MPALSRLALKLFAVAISGTVLAGCGTEGSLPPVFGAVFGVAGARTNPYSVGTVGDTVPRSGDTVIGTAANSPGNCIWQSGERRRFRSACPEGYRL
ncbi:hypothetical protein Sa4125_34220 [Aureimonas sp. SA4125]|uniref:hypothetical protein n=1 Tax=Aureimonas sp. SA4125 TaxID=2826993 RepID=UPI001CC548BC|nr:hypothetical protein [Aureimonas sp. SA4125]BDA85880.1 hypothetical protein Sa4125_34220 [Aureimonas sp. SA4125]